jgi:ribosomal protein S18 acetylase RimI-like enzyme
MTENKQTNLPYLLRRLDKGDFDNLSSYVNSLSAETRKRFGPHAFDKQSMVDFYRANDLRLGYIAVDLETDAIVAYAIIKRGCLEHDSARLESYGLILDQEQDSSFAPSVADSRQGQGLGSSLLQFIIADLKTRNINRILLWGGVQADNERAIHYYQKNGFTRLGQFEHNGSNYDMILSLQ